MQNCIHRIKSGENNYFVKESQKCRDQAYSWGKVALVTMNLEPIRIHATCHSLPIVKVSHANRVEMEALAIEPETMSFSGLEIKFGRIALK